MRDINFLESYIDSKKKIKKIVLKAFLTILMVSVTFLGLYYYCDSRINYYDQKLKTLESELNSEELIAGVKKYNETKQKLEILSQYYSVIDDIHRQINNVANIKTETLKDIEGTFPEGVFIKVMSSSTEEIIFQGVARNRVVIAEFQHNLKGLHYFSNIHVNIITDESSISNHLVFNVKCTFKDVKKDET